MKKAVVLAMLLTASSALANMSSELVLTSPDGRNKTVFSKQGNELTYSVSVDGDDVVLPSRAGLDVDNWAWEMALGKRDLKQPACWMDMLVVDSVTYHAPVDSVWHPKYGERSAVTDRPLQFGYTPHVT